MTPKNVLILGAGNIGHVVALLLAEQQAYHVTIADIEALDDINPPHSAGTQEIDSILFDAQDAKALKPILKSLKIDVVISCLPHYLTLPIAEVVADHGCWYLDLTEDVRATEALAVLAKKTKATVVPQCGLAPGFISIIAEHLIQSMDHVDTVKMRVGALPKHASNALQYALSWSTDGLINEYIQDCRVLRQGVVKHIPGLTGLETIKIDGITYEAFHTSGGIGSLVESYQNQIQHMDYKTIRYPGHCAHMHFLLRELKLAQHPEWMRKILESAIPQTEQDMVLVYVSVMGEVDDRLVERSFAKKFYPRLLQAHHITAIQATTASSVCAVLAWMHTQDHLPPGLLKQETIPYAEFIDSPFGAMFGSETGDVQHDAV